MTTENDNHLYDSFEDIQRAGKVVPLSRVISILQRTEPVEELVISTDGTSNVKAHFPDGWNFGLKELDETLLTSAKLNIGGTEYTLNKRAALALMTLLGISERYAYKVPGHLIEPHVDYWFKNEGVGNSTQIKMLSKDGFAVGFMPVNSSIISNLEVVDQIRKYFKGKTDGSDIFVDPRIRHTYIETDFRLVLPKVQFSVNTTRNGEVEVDKWHFGVHFQNSLVANSRTPLTLTGYMLEQQTLAGVLPEHSQLTGFNRQTGLGIDDLRGWVRSTLDQIMAVLPVEAEAIQDMVNHSLESNLGETVTDIFQSMKVHRKAQEATIDYITTSGDLTAYGVMHSLGRASSQLVDDLAPQVINHLQRVAGVLPNRTEAMCNSCGRIHMVH